MPVCSTVLSAFVETALEDMALELPRHAPQDVPIRDSFVVAHGAMEFSRQAT